MEITYYKERKSKGGVVPGTLHASMHTWDGQDIA